METKPETKRGNDVTKSQNETQASDIDRGHAWVVLAANYASFVTCGSFLMTSGIVHTALLAKYRQSIATTAWAGAVFTAALSLTSPIGSAIVDRYSCRVAVMVGSAMVTAGFIMTGWAPNIEFCIFSYGFVAGTGGGITYGVLFVVNGFNFKEKLNLAQGICFSGTGLGLFVTAPLLEMTKAEFGYTGLFFVLAGISMQMLVFGALMRPSSLERNIKALRTSQQNSRALTSVEKIKGQINTYGHALCNPYMILLSVSMFFFLGAIYTMFLHWPKFCLQIGFSPMQGSYVLSIVGLVSIVGRFASGIVASLRYVRERLVFSGSMAILGFSMVLFFLYSKTFSGHIALAVLVGLFNGSPLVVMASLSARGVGVQFLSSAVGMQLMFGGVGSIVMPVISGYMIQGGVSYDTIFIVCGLSMILAAALGFGTKFVEESDDTMTKTVEVKIVPEKEALVDVKADLGNPVLEIELNDFPV